MCVTNGNKYAPSPDFVEHRIYMSVLVELEMIDISDILSGLLQLDLKEVSNICSCVTKVQSRYNLFKCLLSLNFHLLSTFQG